jgi:ABC-type glycerol-3-phosphate transport system substrate-binding protein
MSRLIQALTFAGALTLALAACGGDSAATTTPTLPTLTEEAAGEDSTTTTTVAVDPEEAFQDYTACMQEHGIEMPEPGDGEGVMAIGGDGLDIEAFEEAGAECDPILEAAFGEFELSPEQEAEMMDQQLAFAQCMRDNGVDWPDPSSDGSTMIELGDDTDPEQVNAAMQICSPEMLDGSGGVIIGEATP